MKNKTINSVITKKINSWIETIKDPIVKELAKKNTIVTGGCITSMLLNEKINDFDIYFRDIETTYAVAKYYANIMEERINQEINTQLVSFGDRGWQEYEEKTIDTLTDEDKIPKKGEDILYRVRCFIQSSGIAKNQEDKDSKHNNSGQPNQPSISKLTKKKIKKRKKEKKYFPVYITSNAITLSDDLQIVIRFYGDPEKIHDNYDYVHATNYWTSWDGKVVTNIKALESILSKNLLYVGSRYPLASILRMRKFINRGWVCNAGQILKMVYNLNEMDLNDFYVLEEQLTGVDVHYFGQILDALKKKKEKNPDDLLDGIYFMKIIEKIFDN